MHNLNYLKVAYEVLPENVYIQEEMKNVRIMYKHQILLGQKLNCHYYRDGENHVIAIKNEDDSVLHAMIELN
jgi:medium-chain acyl-[acyl-carrier-protein] hydrolase